MNMVSISKAIKGKIIAAFKISDEVMRGKAVETINREIKQIVKTEQLLTIYLGDDTTDEDAFKVLRRPQGWSIFVGQENPVSNADYFLNSTSEALTFLSRLLELKQRPL